MDLIAWGMMEIHDRRESLLLENRVWLVGGGYQRFMVHRSSWWFQVLLMFTPTWGRFPI